MRFSLAIQSLFLVVGVAWTVYGDLPLNTGSGPWFKDAATGLLGGGVLVGINYWLVCRAPAVGPMRSLQQVHEMLKATYSRLTKLEVVVLVMITAMGQELMFRGVLQQEFGLVPASIFYGVLYTRGPAPRTLGVWATLMGAALGWLTLATGGLLAPVVANALCCAASAAYVRREQSLGTEPPCGPRTRH